MKQYLIDTNICIFYLKGMYNVSEKINSKTRKYSFLSDITVAELYYGATLCNRKEQALKEVNDFISLFTVIPISGSLLTFAEKKQN